MDVSHREAMLNPQRYSQQKYMRNMCIYIYIYIKQESKDLEGFTFSNEQFFHWKIPDQS